jgi:hypothetical protein
MLSVDDLGRIQSALDRAIVALRTASEAVDEADLCRCAQQDIGAELDKLDPAIEELEEVVKAISAAYVDAVRASS